MNIKHALNSICIIVAFIIGCQAQRNDQASNTDTATGVFFDSHVHIMSPYLVEYWKNQGVPFSRPDSYYSDVDSILQENKADNIYLVGMGYVFEHPEYYTGDDSRQRLMNENDYLLGAAGKYPKRIKPFFAVDPLKDYAPEELERCYRKFPESGLKLHFNVSQVYLTEPDHLQKVRRVFKQAAAFDLPILLHFDNWHPEFGARDIEILIDSVLAALDTAHIQIAHFGTSGGFNEKTKRIIEAYVQLRDQKRIPSRHNIVFDISAVALDKDSEGVSKLTDTEFAELKSYIDRIGAEHIVFGTDYPLYNSIEYMYVLREKLGLDDSDLELMTK